mmetsp:Transcript_2869/g.10373  ORF Transcript_2869/g.10373 Transcript_2869/m.10373 type:complete len:304 (+) Transcript_2869:2879-3790(+)
MMMFSSKNPSASIDPGSHVLDESAGTRFSIAHVTCEPLVGHAHALVDDRALAEAAHAMKTTASIASVVSRARLTRGDDAMAIIVRPLDRWTIQTSTTTIDVVRSRRTSERAKDAKRERDIERRAPTVSRRASSASVAMWGVVERQTGPARIERARLSTAVLKVLIDVRVYVFVNRRARLRAQFSQFLQSLCIRRRDAFALEKLRCNRNPLRVDHLSMDRCSSSVVPRRLFGFRASTSLASSSMNLTSETKVARSQCCVSFLIIPSRVSPLNVKLGVSARKPKASNNGCGLDFFVRSSCARQKN